MKRVLSKDARQRIAAAQRARWAKTREAKTNGSTLEAHAVKGVRVETSQLEIVLKGFTVSFINNQSIKVTKNEVA